MSLQGIKMRGQDLSPCIRTLSFSLSLTKECLEFPAPYPTGRAHLTGKADSQILKAFCIHEGDCFLGYSFCLSLCF